MEPAAEEEIRSRSGYTIEDLIRNFRACLEQSGAEAAAKSLHFSADIICSGCFQYWQRCLWDYVYDHVGLASPRIFHFLKGRFEDLQKAYDKLPAEQFYRIAEYQKSIAECVLLVRACPRRPPFKMPRVPPETHTGEWVRASTGSASPSLVVGRVFRQGTDMPILRAVGNEFAKCCGDGNTEKALFWLKWLHEEEAWLKKHKEGQLSTADRGPVQWPQKQRAHVGFYLAALLGEIYKDLRTKSGLRMDEETRSLIHLYAYPNKLLSQKRRFETLCLLAQLMCEVPKWKVPAAPSLVKDPLALQRAVSHAESFFREVLAFDAPAGDVEKAIKKALAKASAAKTKVLTEKQKKELAIQEQLAMYDSLIDSWVTGT